MKPHKYNNFVPFLDFLFCLTITYISLFILSITQIKQIQLIKNKQVNSLNLKNNELETNIIGLNKSIILEQEAKKQFKDELLTTEIQNIALSVLNNDLSNKLKNIEKENEELKKKGNWKTNAKLAIEVTWSKTANDDIDIYILTPDKKVVYFNNQVGTGVFVDRDDLGNQEFGDQHIEIANFIKLLDTKSQPYLINLHAYSKRFKETTPVTLKLYKINEESSEVVFEKTFSFKTEDQVESVFEIYTKDKEFDKIIESNKIIPNLVESIKKMKETQR